MFTIQNGKYIKFFTKSTNKDTYNVEIQKFKLICMHLIKNMWAYINILCDISYGTSDDT